MKFKILHALITDKKGELIRGVINSNSAEDIEIFIYNFISQFTHLELSYLEEIYKDDKDNVAGMLEDLYPMLVFTEYNDYKEFICSDWFEGEEE